MSATPPSHEPTGNPPNPNAGVRSRPEVTISSPAGFESEFDSPLVQAVARRRPFKGFVHASFLGLVGAVIWGAVAAVSGYESGLVAVLLGFLVGNGAKKGGTGGLMQCIGAFCAAKWYFIGKWLALLMVFAYHPEMIEAGPDAGGMFQTQAPVVVSKPTSSHPAGSAPSPQTDPAIDPIVAEFEEWIALPPEQQWATHPVWIALIGIPVVFLDTFTSISLLFLGIAVYEGYKIPRAE